MSVADAMIVTRGEQIKLYRRTQIGVDEYNRPEYDWPDVGNPTSQPYAIFDKIREDEIIVEAGEIIVADYKIYFKSIENVLKDDQVIWNTQRFEIIAIQQRRHTSAPRFKVAYSKRLIEQ